MPAVQRLKAVPPGPGYWTNGALTLTCAFKEAVIPKTSKHSSKENNGFCISAARREGEGKDDFHGQESERGPFENSCQR